MNHFRDTKAGKFYVDRNFRPEQRPGDVVPFLRFAHRCGGAADLWSPGALSAGELVERAGLFWVTEERAISMPSRRSPSEDKVIYGYKALVRTDTEAVMSVEKSTYSVAQNEWVVDAVMTLAERWNKAASMVGAVGFGRMSERTLYAVRLQGDDREALCLLAHNTHGGEGAVRFQLVHADRPSGAVLTPNSIYAARTVPHVGNIEEHLEAFATYSTFIADYVSDVTPLLDGLYERPWTPGRTENMIRELWGRAPDLQPKTPDGTLREPSEEAFRHPGRNLMSSLEDCTDAGNAFRILCSYLDNESEACERGDYTKDRDERLAVGAGTKMKQRAWSWILANTDE
jgi:hypothetical protein